MEEQDHKTVSIDIGAKMFRRFEDLPNTVSHVLAEFVDNALQSYRDNKEALHALEPNYKLQVNIDITWDETATKESDRSAVRFIITDNAAGIDKHHYAHAFRSAETPEDNTGLNEFGMGLKTAACWLGGKWSVETLALGEETERIFRFDIEKVTEQDLKELPYETKIKNVNSHGTRIVIESPTKNVPRNRSLGKIRDELSSIYRNSLRQDELDIIVNDNPLEFTEYNILASPFIREKQGQIRKWRHEIDFKFGKYRAKGFIAILRDINSQQNGLVLSRRGRVIIGAETDGRYFSKYLSGSSGTFRYKRIFGELELEGFAVSFNKNDIQDKENLEMLMEAIRDDVRQRDPEFFVQADEYRLDANRKSVKKIIKTHDNAPKSKQQTVVITSAEKEHKSQYDHISNLDSSVGAEENIIIDQYQRPDNYSIGGTSYELRVVFIQGNTTDLFYIGKDKKRDNVITCNINTEHEFFKQFNGITPAITILLKTLAMAKISADKEGNGSASELIEFFNICIKKVQV